MLLLASVLTAQAPPTTHVLGVFFWHDSPNDAAAFTGIQAGLAASKLPHTLVVRRADADADKARTAIAELRAEGCELIFAMGTESALRLSAAVTDLPIVYAAVTNPVASGVVANWNGSGRNLAGASNWIAPETVLHVFQLAIPDLRKLGMLQAEPASVVSKAELATMRQYLQKPGAPKVEVLTAGATSRDDIPRAVQQLQAEGAQAIWIPIDIGIYKHMDMVRQALAANPVPLVATAVNGPADGAIVGTTVDFVLHGRRTAAIATDILQHGTQPGSIPVDTMRGYLVVANLGAARRAGHELPLSLLAIADVLIDQESQDAVRPPR